MWVNWLLSRVGVTISHGGRPDHKWSVERPQLAVCEFQSQCPLLPVSRHHNRPGSDATHVFGYDDFHTHILGNALAACNSYGKLSRCAAAGSE